MGGRAASEAARAVGAAAEYGVREVADLLGLAPPRIRAWVRAGFVTPVRGPRGALRFCFRDLSLLRTLRDLEAGRIPPRRVRRALDRLRAVVPERELGSVGLASAGNEIVVRDGDALWSPESGQYCFDFAPRPERRVISLKPGAKSGTTAENASAEDWRRLGEEWLASEPERAIEALRRAVALDPTQADAQIDLGCLLHERGELVAAEACYRAALRVRPGDATAHFDLAVVLDDQGRDAEARAAYESALAADPACAEAHYNLARLCERGRDRAGALRHLTAYRRLARPS